jgi:putative transposase
MRLAVLQLLSELAKCRAHDGLRGVQLRYETIRRWCDKFGPSSLIASDGSGRRPATNGISTKSFLKINGVQHYLWRAVDQHRAVIDILVQRKRDRVAAVRFFHKLLKSTQRHPGLIITDKLRSYGLPSESCCHMSHIGKAGI